MSAKYEELADRAERGELTVKPGTVRRGDDTHDEAREFLLEATGTATTQEAVRIAVGRPPLGAKGGKSPVVRARVTRTLKVSVAALAEREHRAESDIVRKAVTEYVNTRRVP